MKFKSTKLYYDKEKSGEKNNTVRKVEQDDPRYAELIRMDRCGVCDSDFITIERVELPKPSFTRQIKHVCLWQGLFIITWRT